MERLYEKLRQLVSDDYTIIITDQVRGMDRDKAEVTIQHWRNDHPWTGFQGKTVFDSEGNVQTTAIEDALQRAVLKFQHPKQDYLDIRGKVWKASEGSIYGEEHIRRMLRHGKD